MARTFIVIAAYNEEARIGAVIRGLAKQGYRNVIVVDDHSHDATGQSAASAGAIVVHHTRNRGQGAALRTGIQRALKEGAEIVVTFDGDGQHRASEIKRLTAPIEKGEVDVSLGSRYLGSAPGMPCYKRFTLWGSRFVERVLLGVRLTDVHNGFRALNRDAARRIRITCDRMAHASEIVYRIHHLGLRFREVPVTIAYDEYTRARGQSIFNSFRILWDILKLRMR